MHGCTFYRYKKLIGKQCQKILDRQSEEDISLAVFQLEQRYTKYLASIEKKLDTDATNNRNTELYEMAAKLAKKIFNLKCKGSTLVMRWRKDRQDIEVITGYISASDRRIQIPEYEEEVGGGGGGGGEDIETEPK
jgi:excinuclease UvrABC nuclease subunit